MSTLIKNIDESIDYCLQNPGNQPERTLLCFAALDMSLGHVLRDHRPDCDWFAASARETIKSIIPSQGTCGLIDTTTLLNGFGIIGNKWDRYN